MNKIPNKLMFNVVLNAKKYSTIDTFIILSSLSTQVRFGTNKFDCAFVIPSHNSFYSLWSYANEKFPNIISSTSFRFACKELIELGVLTYNDSFNGFELVDMINMVKPKSLHGLGFTRLREFLTSDLFFNMNFSQKKLILYSFFVLDKGKKSIAFKMKYHVDLFFNIGSFKKPIKSNKFDTTDFNIMNILHTKNVYYAKKVFLNLINKFPDIFEDVSERERISRYNKSSGKIKGEYINLIYFVNFNRDILNDNIDLDNSLNQLAARYPNIYEYISQCESHYNLKIHQSIKIALLRHLFSFKEIPFVYRSVVNNVIFRTLQSSYDKLGPIMNLNAYVNALVNKFNKVRGFNYYSMN